ncbi:MAG: DUF2877 domain-containing protein, partial [Alphaproteobacteria bacterium]|nr:DUF2877 domain-containing protein [Alphaproteobacteria bacterium]
MRFVASEMPAPSARSIEGHVHSVFRRVVNLRLADGDLLTLYAGGEDRQPPGAVRFAAPPAFDFSDHVFHRAAVSYRAGILRIAGTDFSLDLRQARASAQTPIEPTQAGSGFSGSWRAGWHILLSINVAAGLVVSLNGRRAAGSLDGALAARARKTVPRLLNAAQKNDVEAALAAAAQLVGAGPGLTPSGDDFLAGFLVGARQTAQTDAALSFVDTLGRRLTEYCCNSG